MWLDKGAGCGLQDRYPRVGWIGTRYCSRLEDMQCAKIGLHAGCKACEKILLSSTAVATLAKSPSDADV